VEPRLTRFRYTMSAGPRYNSRFFFRPLPIILPRGGHVSPIPVRPVRDQRGAARVIRLLQVRLKRRHDVVTNIGEEQTVPVKIGQVQIFPDLVLTSTERGHKLMGTV